MTRPYKLECAAALPPSHPLHWSRFWPDLKRVHKGTSQARQDLVLWLAKLHSTLVRSNKPLGFCEVQVRLLDLREMVRDYQPALEHFFEVKRKGFFIDEEKQELSTLVPRELTEHDLPEIERVTRTLIYSPPALPLDSSATVSSVTLLEQNIEELTLECNERGCAGLVAPIQWLIDNGPMHKFYFVKSGKLQQRDTSVYPISGIETWPSWLRERLFGPGIDLDSAYVQFLLQVLKGELSPTAIETMFPDLLRLLNDKEKFREELCTQIFCREYTAKYKDLVKRTLMSIANGSKISSTLLCAGSRYSKTAEIILEQCADTSEHNLTIIGDRLKQIADQFAQAKRLAALVLFGKAPNRANVKKIFSSYFEWERKARYAIWEECGKSGIMVHDGLDGIPEKYRTELPRMMEKLALKLSA